MADFSKFLEGWRLKFSGVLFEPSRYALFACELSTALNYYNFAHF